MFFQPQQWFEPSLLFSSRPSFFFSIIKKKKKSLSRERSIWAVRLFQLFLLALSNSDRHRLCIQLTSAIRVHEQVAFCDWLPSEVIDTWLLRTKDARKALWCFARTWCSALWLLTIRKTMIGNLTKYDRINRVHLREVFLMFPCLFVLLWRAAHISLDAISFFCTSSYIRLPNKTGSREQIECTVQMISAE